jgi:hypothetical protein
MGSAWKVDAALTVKAGRKSDPVVVDSSKARITSGSIPKRPPSQQKGPIVLRQQLDKYMPDPSPCLLARPLLIFFLLCCRDTVHTWLVSGL